MQCSLIKMTYLETMGNVWSAHTRPCSHPNSYSLHNSNCTDTSIVTSSLVPFSHASYYSPSRVILFHLIWTLESKPNLGRDRFLSRRKTFWQHRMPNLYCRSQMRLSTERVMAHIWYSSQQHLIFWCSIHCFPVWDGRDSSSSWQVLSLESVIRWVDAEIMGGKKCC